MTQTWDTRAYQKNGAFVHKLADGVLEWLAPQPGERILDLGCGDGQLTARLVATGAIVVGVDASAEMLAAARVRGIDAHEGRATRIKAQIMGQIMDRIRVFAAHWWISSSAGRMPIS